MAASRPLISQMIGWGHDVSERMTIFMPDMFDERFTREAAESMVGQELAVAKRPARIVEATCTDRGINFTVEFLDSNQDTDPAKREAK